jgi:hypothetical protein
VCCLQHILDYEDKSFANVSKEDLKLDEDEEQKQKEKVRCGGGT